MVEYSLFPDQNTARSTRECSVAIQHRIINKLFVPACSLVDKEGREAEELVGEAVRVAEYNRKGLGDLAHWSALNWEGHWRQRIGVEIMRGVARCIQRSADSSSMVASVSGRRRNLEYDRHCC